MMFPLWTSVTLRRWFLSAYSIAARISRSLPSIETGLTPMLELSGKRIFLTPISFWRKSITFFTSGVPAFHSIPA